MTIKEWFIEAYDEHVRSSGDEGVLLAQSRQAVAELYAEAVESGAIARWSTDPLSEGIDLFDKSVTNGERSSRKTSLRSSVDHILDAIRGDTILGDDDPVLSVAFPVGDGRDKVLRSWSLDDWQSTVTGRYRNAAQVTVAASEFDERVQVLLSFMNDRMATSTGDLFAAVHTTA